MMKSPSKHAIPLTVVVAISIWSTAIGMQFLGWYCNYAAETLSLIYRQMSGF